MLNVAFDKLTVERKSLKANINKQEGLKLARQEKNDVETENANATYHKTFDAQLDLLIKQIETQPKSGTPEERKVEEIFEEANQKDAKYRDSATDKEQTSANFRELAENAIAQMIGKTQDKVGKIDDILQLELITDKEQEVAETRMTDLTKKLKKSLKLNQTVLHASQESTSKVKEIISSLDPLSGKILASEESLKKSYDSDSGVLGSTETKTKFTI